MSKTNDFGTEAPGALPGVASRSIDWYAAGQCRHLIIGGMRVTVRVVALKGRRVRLDLIAPAGTAFMDSEELPSQGS